MQVKGYQMEYPIAINYKYTSNIYTAKEWLRDLPNLIACDLEIASKFTQQEKDLMKFRLDNRKLSFEEYRVLLQHYESNGFSHPSLTVITHLSIAWSDRDSLVIVCDTEGIRQFIIRFLITTDCLQLWHNTPFDHKHIKYNSRDTLNHMGRQPKNFLDTMLMSKCLLNDANPCRDKVSLKELMAYAYGDWAISKEEFTLEEMWKESTIKYSGTDACATFKLYQDLQEETTKWRI